MTVFSKMRCVALAALFLPLLLSAQGTERYFGGPGPDRALAMLPAPDGGFVLAGNTAKHPDSLPDMLFMRTDAAGNLLLWKEIGLPDKFESANALLPAPGGGFLLAGETGATATSPHRAMAVLVDSQGVVVWELIAGQDSVYISSGTASPDGGWLLAGFIRKNGRPNSYILKIDAFGNFEWDKIPYLSFGLLGITSLSNGNYYATGEFEIPNPFGAKPAAFILKINNLGEVLDTQTISYPGDYDYVYCRGLRATSDGNFMVFCERNAHGVPGYVVFKYSPDLEILSGFYRPFIFNVAQEYSINDAIETTNQKVALAGKFLSQGSPPSQGHLIFENWGSAPPFLDSINVRTFGGPLGDFFNAIAPTQNNGFALAGQTSSFGDGSVNVYLVITDSLGNTFSNHVRGSLRADENFNCTADTAETPLRGWLVEANSGTSGTRYALTDSLGRYEIGLPTGPSSVRVRPPSGYWAACLDSVPIFFQNLNTDTTLDFAIQTEIQCPLLYVDATAPVLRRCFENTYFVHYQNFGTVSAPDARIEIALDPFLEITGADLPFQTSPGGDTVVFALGEVPLFGSGDFKFRVLVDCDSTVLGQTHCVEAHIFPDSICGEINAAWDFSNLTINGLCLGDSLVVTLSNVGAGDMASAVEYVITEDLIIIKNQLLKLAAGQDTTFVIYPGGSTVRVTAMQTPGNPFSSSVSFVIEACGGLPGEWGIPLQFPPDDADPWTDIECRQNVGSFDPNDKFAVPAGVGEGLQQILQNTDLEYLIRFQNTGTDTAFRVEIRDTLSPLLDLATLRLGASSHSYRLEMLENGALRFIFENIRLPDSSVNFDGSQGFVKFRISQKPGLAAGLRLENRAAIYFDFNAPVLTNTVWHTVVEEYDLPTVSLPDEPFFQKNKTPAVRVAPNPFSDKTLITWTLQHAYALGGAQREQHGAQREPQREQVFKFSKIEITDVSGRHVGLFFSEKNELILKKEDLPAGVFFLKITTPGGVVLAGKVVKI